MLFSGRAHPELAEEIAERPGRRCSSPTDAHDFANGEIYVRFEESVRGCDAFVIQSHTAPINEWLMEQLIMVDALKRASAKRITVVAAVLSLRPAGQEGPRPRADLRPPGRRPVQDRRRRPASWPSTCTPRRSRASSTARSTTSSPSRCSPTTSASAVDRATLTVVSPDTGRVRVAELWARPAGRRAAGVHPQDAATRACRTRSGANERRRRGRRPHLHPGRRHDRHRRHDRAARARRCATPAPPTSSSPRPTPCSPARPSTG